MGTEGLHMRVIWGSQLGGAAKCALRIYAGRKGDKQLAW